MNFGFKKTLVIRPLHIPNFFGKACTKKNLNSLLSQAQIFCDTSFRYLFKVPEKRFLNQENLADAFKPNVTA